MGTGNRLGPPERVLGIRVREIAHGLFVGTIGSQVAVNAAFGPSGCRVVYTDLRKDETLAFGIGRDLERAEEDAQVDFARRQRAKVAAQQLAAARGARRAA